MDGLSKLYCGFDSEMQRALLPPLTAHDGGEADVMEHGGGFETFGGALTRKRKPIVWLDLAVKALRTPGATFLYPLQSCAFCCGSIQTPPTVRHQQDDPQDHFHQPALRLPLLLHCFSGSCDL